MKTFKLFVSVALLSAFSTVAMADAVLMESLLSEDKSREIAKRLLKVQGNDAATNAAEVNRYLRTLKDPNVPLINIVSGKLEMTTKALEEEDGTKRVHGAEFNDGTNRYCFPCINEGIKFWGVRSNEREKARQDTFASNLAAYKNFYGKCSYDAKATYVARINTTSCNTDTAPSICSMTAECVKGASTRKVTRKDGSTVLEGVDGFNATLSATCLAPDDLCPNDPLECAAGASFAEIAKGAAAIGPKGHTYHYGAETSVEDKGTAQ